MGTSNFAYNDTLYAIEIEDELDLECLTDNMHELLKSLDKSMKPTNKKMALDIYANDEPYWSNSSKKFESNFSSKEHGEVQIKSDFMGFDLKLILKVLVRNGYYAHVNIDYDMALHIDGCEGFEDDDAHGILNWVCVDHLGAGVVAMNTKHLDKRIDDMKALALEVYHHIGKQLGTEYNLASRASNGETSFTKVEQTAETFDHLKLVA